MVCQVSSFKCFSLRCTQIINGVHEQNNTKERKFSQLYTAKKSKDLAFFRTQVVQLRATRTKPLRAEGMVCKAERSCSESYNSDEVSEGGRIAGKAVINVFGRLVGRLTNSLSGFQKPIITETSEEDEYLKVDDDEDTSAPWWYSLEVVFCLSFQEEGEKFAGFYANRVLNDDGIPVDIILAFESLEDAVRHGGLLEASIPEGKLMPEPQIQMMDPETLVSICEEKGCQCSVRREGSLLMPPEELAVQEDLETVRQNLERLL